MNRLAKELNDQVFAELDCLSCAKCCKGIPPIMLEEDIKRIADSIDMKPEEFTSKHTQIDEDGDRVMKSSPCIFLLDDNTCSVYPLRPKACQEYPLLENRFVENINYHMVNKDFCPATEQVIQKIKQSIQWL